MPASSNTPSPTTRKQILLRRYEIGKVLGQGSFGKVYVATNVITNQMVAIKVIDKEKILKTGLISHIKREISILRRVRHPNIVQLYEVMATKTKIYFVMEYVKGGELFTKVAKGRLKEEIARKYFQQLISAVGFCHARGVYHRDLKPENILLDENGDLKVSDFGLSAISEKLCEDNLFYTFCGTPAYVAPEVLGRKGYEATKVDIWACGVILFVLMAGYLPFRDENVMLMYRKIFKREFRKPRWFSSELSRLLKRLLDISPETRISMAEIMEDKWFKKGFKNVKFYFEDDKIYSVKDCEDDDDSVIEYCSDQSCCDSENSVGLVRPMSLNAFDLILFSPRFSLSGLFEDGSEESRFVTSESVSKVVSTLEKIAKSCGFSNRRKDCRVSLEGSKEGVKGPLMIVVEIFELTTSLRVVEVRKKEGDTNEYEGFFESQLWPGLQPLMLSGSSGESSELLSDISNEERNGSE